MSKEDLAGFTTGFISGGVYTFLQENWAALFVVPFIAGMIGIVGKTVGRYLIDLIKTKINAKRSKKDSQETE